MFKLLYSLFQAKTAVNLNEFDSNEFDYVCEEGETRERSEGVEKTKITILRWTSKFTVFV